MELHSSRTRDFTSRTLRVWITMLAVASLGLAGCAAMTSTTDEVAIEPRGPGYAFATIEDAVIDAMAFSVMDARRTGQSDRMYGGAISMVEGGYTYAEPVVASSWKPLDIRYRITSADVARFHVYPEARDMRENQQREHCTRWDRVSVDDRDPRHRTLYFLTPSMMVKAYHGKSLPVQEVARLDRAHDGLMLVQNVTPMP